jgi:hypothetical protein
MAEDRTRSRPDWPPGPDVDPARVPVRAPEASAGAAEEADDPEARTTVLALFGSAKRAGRWEPPARVQVLSLFGGVHIDFTEAEMLEGETVVEIFAFCGGVEIRVPPDIDVITEGFGLFGHFGQKDQRGDDPQPPRLRVKGLALMSGVEVKGPRRRG